MPWKNFEKVFVTMFQYVSEAVIGVKMSELQSVLLKISERIVTFLNLTVKYVNDLQCARQRIYTIDNQQAYIVGLAGLFLALLKQ